MLIVSTPRCRVFPDWDGIQMVSSSQKEASAQATTTWQQTRTTPGEDGEFLFWKFETNILYFIALSWKFDSNLNFSKLGVRKFLDISAHQEKGKQWKAAFPVCFWEFSDFHSISMENLQLRWLIKIEFMLQVRYLPSTLDSEMGLQNEMGTYYSTLRELCKVNAQPILVTQVWKIGDRGVTCHF